MSLRPAVLLSLLALLCAAGCANLVETRAINAFAEALADHNVEELKGATTSRFAEKSLRLSESMNDFAILKLPKGDVEVVETENVSDDEKRVTVEVGESKQRLKYRLVRDANTRKWVVDDVYIRRKKDGIASTKPVTELMDLVTTVREFLKAWGGGYQQDMVRFAEPQLAGLLTNMPRPYLTKLAERAIGDRADEARIRPEAQMDDDVAVVRLPRKSGQMLISFRKIDEHWLISDMAVESKRDKEHISSVKQLATALVSATKFLDAYVAGDKPELEKVSDKTFFQNCLEPAALSTVILPTSEQAVDTYQMRMDGGIADFVIPRSSEVVKLSLARIESEDSETPIRYEVKDVTLYELDGREEKQLSALFLSHALVDLFAEALSLRELESLRVMTTDNFRSSVWRKLDEQELLRLPMPEIENQKPHILTTIFMGEVTEVTVSQGTRALVYVLRNENGNLLVDDVLIPVVNRPNSLKKNLEAVIPVFQFAAAYTQTDFSRLQRLSSNDMNSTVWHQTATMPGVKEQIEQHVSAPVTSLELSEERAVIGFGDDRFGARVLLVREGEDRSYVVDDVRVISGPELNQRTDLKTAMRLEISRFRKPNEQAPIRRASGPVPAVVPVSAEELSLEPLTPTVSKTPSAPAPSSQR